MTFQSLVLEQQSEASVCRFYRERSLPGGELPIAAHRHPSIGLGRAADDGMSRAAAQNRRPALSASPPRQAGAQVSGRSQSSKLAFFGKLTAAWIHFVSFASSLSRLSPRLHARKSRLFVCADTQNPCSTSSVEHGWVCICRQNFCVRSKDT